MKNLLLGLVYAVGIILVETLIVVAWYCSPLVINFDASPIVLGTVIALPIITACITTKNNRNNLVEKGIFIGLALWCLMMVPICWALPMLISKKLIFTSLLIYLILSIGSCLCSANIRNLQAAKKPKPQTEEN